MVCDELRVVISLENGDIRPLASLIAVLQM